MPFYAVRAGREPGIFKTWDECKVQIEGFKGAKYKKFSTESEAQDFVDGKTTAAATAENGGQTATTTPAEDRAAKKRKADDNIASLSKACVTCGKDLVQVYTDGSCEGNGHTGATGGIGVYWGDGHKNNLAIPLYGRQTNNRAEITAVCETLKQCIEQKIGCVRVLTDSQFLIKAMNEWWTGWEKKGFKKSDGTDVVNQEEFKELKRLKDGLHVEFVHVPGHSGVPGNEMADKLSREGAAKNRAEQKSKSSGGSSGGTSEKEQKDKSHTVEKKKAAKDGDSSSASAVVVDVYVHGRCEGNSNAGTTGGIGVYYGESDDRNCSESLTGKQSPHRANISAISKALQQCIDGGVKGVRVHLESDFILKAVNQWWKGWEKRGFKKADGTPVANQAEFIELKRLRDQLESVEFIDSSDSAEQNKAAMALSKEGVKKKPITS